MSLPNATKLGPYEIGAPLGAGGMGEVYLARDTRLDRTVAIKVLPESLATDSDRLLRFEQEARALSTVSHPNLLAIYDVGTEGAVHFLVSEFLEGHTLRERMTAGALPQRKIADYALQLANGLAAAHDKGIVHRDLKPENIFITNDERIKILDFGLAKQSPFAPTFTGAGATISSPAATAPGTVLGTVGYMSPEQVRGDVVDHRSDIFSFGAILYEIISGNRAFQGDSSVETMNAILKEDPPELDPLQAKVSPAMNRIVRHCLEKNPASRFQSARDLAFALGALSGTDSTASLAATPASSQRWWLAAATAALALAILSLVMFQFRRQHAPFPEKLEFAIPLQQEAGHLALSPDGHMLVFVSPDEVSGSNMLSVRPVGSSKVTVLPGTEGASYPFWSPDDTYIAFFADGKLKKIPSSGGAPQALASAFAARGGSWGRRGVIIYAPSVGGWIWSVNADGSNAKPLTDKIYAGGAARKLPGLFWPSYSNWSKWKCVNCWSSTTFPGDDTPIIIGSALKALEGDQSDIGEPTIMKLADALDNYIPEPERAIDGPFLMPVEDVFSISGRGTVVTGRIERGIVKVGEEIEIVGIKPTLKTTCTGVEMFRKLLDQGQAGDNVGVLLRGTKREEVERGQVLAKPGSIKPHTKFTAEIYVLSKDEGGRHTPFFKGYRPQFYFRTTDVTGSGRIAGRHRNGDAGRQRQHHGQPDQPDRDGRRSAFRDSRRRPYRRCGGRG